MFLRGLQTPPIKKLRDYPKNYLQVSKFEFYIMHNSSVSPEKGQGEWRGQKGTCWPKLAKLMPVSRLGRLLYLTLSVSGAAEWNLRGMWLKSFSADILFEVCFPISSASKIHRMQTKNTCSIFLVKAFHCTEIFNVAESMLSIHGCVYDSCELWCSLQSKTAKREFLTCLKVKLNDVDIWNMNNVDMQEQKREFLTRPCPRAAAALLRHLDPG